MVEGANTNPTRKNGNTKILGVVFCVLCVIVFGLAIANVAVLLVGKNGGEPEPSEEKFSCADYSEVTDIAQCVREEYEYTEENQKKGTGACTGICNEYAEVIKKRIEKDQPADRYAYIMDIFASYMLAVNDEKSAAGLVYERNQLLLLLQKSSEHLNELLADAIKSDDVLKTPASADEVAALAYRMGNKEIGDKYLEIKRAREKELGIDNSGGQR